jgi:hypothetical protein
MHTYTIACCATRIGQLQLSAGSEYCRMHGLVQGLCNMATQPNTGCKACLTASTHEQACTSIFECSAALTVQLRLFAIYSGYCRMHRVCACLETRYSLQGPLYRRNTSTVGCSSMLGSLSCSYAGAASCCVVVTACTGFVHQTNTARYSLLGMFDRVNTRKQACIRTCVHQQVLQLELVSAVCRLF